jgi:hypothetical protein
MDLYPDVAVFAGWHLAERSVPHMLIQWAGLSTSGAVVFRVGDEDLVFKGLPYWDAKKLLAYVLRHVPVHEAAATGIGWRATESGVRCLQCDGLIRPPQDSGWGRIGMWGHGVGVVVGLLACVAIGGLIGGAWGSSVSQSANDLPAEVQQVMTVLGAIGGVEAGLLVWVVLSILSIRNTVYASRRFVDDVWSVVASQEVKCSCGKLGPGGQPPRSSVDPRQAPHRPPVGERRG